MTDTAIKTEILIHDLKVPISVIDAGAKSLLNRQDTYGPLTDKQKKVLKRIIRNTLVTQRLVNDVLELGRSREGVVNLSEFTVGNLVTSVLVEIFDLCNPPMVDEVRHADSYDTLARILAPFGFCIEFEAGVWQSRVCLDKAKVRQILRNLVSNAYKHRNETVQILGDIRGDIRGDIQGDIRESNRADNRQSHRGGHLVLKVRDDGRGIPPSEHQRIFDTYFTTGGAIDDAINSHGLGLAGVMVLLRDMGGSLTLDSDDGQGAEFTVVIPLNLHKELP